MSNSPYITHEGKPLTIQEYKFIQCYINSSDIKASYLEAYNPKRMGRTDKEFNNYCSTRGSRIRNSKKIASEITYQLEQFKADKVADTQEILEYFTRVMRGEEKDQFGLDTPISERTKAALELAKRIIDMPQKSLTNQQNEVKITLDWSRPDLPIMDADFVEHGKVDNKVGD